MVFRRHSWYLLAHSYEHGKVVQFKLARFRSAEQTGEHFAVPADFSPEEFFDNCWEAWPGEAIELVRVRFAPSVARMIGEVKRHPTQRVFSQPDGSVIFEADVAGIEEIAIWILGYGKYAEVLSPVSLREYIAEHVEGMAEIYEQKQYT